MSRSRSGASRLSKNDALSGARLPQLLDRLGSELGSGPKHRVLGRLVVGDVDAKAAAARLEERCDRPVAPVLLGEDRPSVLEFRERLELASASSTARMSERA